MSVIHDGTNFSLYHRANLKWSIPSFGWLWNQYDSQNYTINKNMLFRAVTFLDFSLKFNLPGQVFGTGGNWKAGLVILISWPHLKNLGNAMGNHTTSHSKTEGWPFLSWARLTWHRQALPVPWPPSPWFRHIKPAELITVVGQWTFGRSSLIK